MFTIHKQTKLVFAEQKGKSQLGERATHTHKMLFSVHIFRECNKMSSGENIIISQKVIYMYEQKKYDNLI